MPRNAGYGKKRFLDPGGSSPFGSVGPYTTRWICIQFVVRVRQPPRQAGQERWDTKRANLEEWGVRPVRRNDACLRETHRQARFSTACPQPCWSTGCLGSWRTVEAYAAQSRW